MKISSVVTGSALIVASWSAASAAPLSDSQLYFDPASLPYAAHAHSELASGDTLNFTSSPGRTIIGANILPTLRDNSYYPGYGFSQNDYEVQPNLGSGETYSADLTGGVLSATFNTEGLYHVRVNYSDGGSDIRAIFVDGGVLGAFTGQDRQNITGPTKKTPSKAGDVIYISTGAADDTAMANAKELYAGQTIVRVSTVDELVSDLETRSDLAGRKLGIVVVGHGFGGSIRLGHGAGAERINNSGNARTTSGTDFANSIKDHASSVNFIGCSTGGTAAGGRLLQDITDAGVPASGYTSTVYLGKANMYLDAWGTKVPTPGTLSLMGLAGMLISRRRRA